MFRIKIDETIVYIEVQHGNFNKTVTIEFMFKLTLVMLLVVETITTTEALAEIINKINHQSIV
jgi:hypothetical protein